MVLILIWHALYTQSILSFLSQFLMSFWGKQSVWRAPCMFLPGVPTDPRITRFRHFVLFVWLSCSPQPKTMSCLCKKWSVYLGYVSDWLNHGLAVCRSCTTEGLWKQQLGASGVSMGGQWHVNLDRLKSSWVATFWNELERQVDKQGGSTDHKINVFPMS